MKRQEVALPLKPLKLSVKETPHITIEPNTTCNIKCRKCYNLNQDHVKSFEQVKCEIDLAFKKRKVETISLLGGEPTIHPDILKIIAYIKSKKVYCQLLTNGISFQGEEGDIFLDNIKKAGVDRILLHIDKGQEHVHNNIDKTVLELFNKFEKRKVFFSLSITIYNDSQGGIPGIIKKYNYFTYFDGILALMERDPIEAFSNNPSPLNILPTLANEYVTIQHALNVEPTTYIPSSIDDDHISWLMYFYYINSKTGQIFRISHQLSRFFRKIYRVFTGRQAFGITFKRPFFPFSLLISGLIECIINPRRIKKFIALLKRSDFTSAMRFHYIVIQDGPEYNKEKEKVHICYHCPDATIRNGKVTPVCIADQINPINKQIENPYFSKELYDMIYKHLEEL